MDDKKVRNRSVTQQVLLIAAPALILFLGTVSAVGLAKQRKPPARAEIAERALRVNVLPAHIEDMPIVIQGFGEAHTRDVVSISPEVSGRVLRVHPHLETGGLIAAGEDLFAIDARDYEARVVEAEALVTQYEAATSRVEKQYELDKSRLETYKRIADLARKEFDRSSALFQKENITSESAVSEKEMSYKQSQDALDQIMQTVNLYPLRIEEARSAFTSATAALGQAKINLERTVIHSPFDARVKTVNIEANQWVTTGSPAVTLADDSMLEIAVALNSSDARQWLEFEEAAQPDTRAWFKGVKHVPVEIAWTEALENNQWQGTLDRVERFDEETRTITVIVRIEGAEASAPRAGNLPIVEGMFCRVRIPGRVAKGVVRLASEIVGFDQDASGMRTVYVAQRNPDSGTTTLETRRVRATHNDGDSVFVSEGLKEGDLVITTRLVSPLENSLLDVQEVLPDDPSNPPTGS